MKIVGRIMAGILLLAGAGCASAPAPSGPAWVGGDAARLAADQADCTRETANIDVNDGSNYSDPRYGVTSAMAAAVGRDNPLTNQKANVRAAVFATCMTDKGWKAQ